MALEDVYIGQDHRIPQLRHFPNPVLDVASTSYRALSVFNGNDYRIRVR